MTLQVGSFTAEVVAEIAPHIPPTEHCRLALLAGMGYWGNPGAEIATTRLVSARAALSAFHADGIVAHVTTVRRPRHAYHVVVSSDVRQPDLNRKCCQRALLRGAFLVFGSLRRPDAAPHLELTVPSAELGRQLTTACWTLQIPMSLAARRGNAVMLFRSAEAVAVFLSSIGAHQGRLRFEDARVVRDVRGVVNRRLNSETANLRRSVIAGVSQAHHIKKVRESSLWDVLPSALREAAELRLAAPGDSLSSLAGKAGCSRSAMAGRLRRLLELDPGGEQGGNVAPGHPDPIVKELRR